MRWQRMWKLHNMPRGLNSGRSRHRMSGMATMSRRSIIPQVPAARWSRQSGSHLKATPIVVGLGTETDMVGMRESFLINLG